jgi:hypothetical protein
MKANELRIGNIVFFDSDSFPAPVTLETFAILFKYPDRLESIKPVILTSEIVSGINPNLSDNGYSNKFTTTGRLEIQLGYSYITTIEFLHEYQNLYFALIGEELKCDLWKNIL